MKAKFGNEFVAGAVVAPGVLGAGPVLCEQVEQEQEQGEEGGQGSGDGGQGEEGEKKDDPDPDPAKEPEEGSESETAEAKASWIGGLKAGLVSRAELVGRAERAELALKASQADLIASKGREAALSAELDGLKGQLGEIKAAWEGTKSEVVAAKQEVEVEKGKQKSTEAAAAEVVAGLGIKAEELPAAEREDESLEGLQARLATAKTPKEKWELQEKVTAKMWAQN